MIGPFSPSGYRVAQFEAVHAVSPTTLHLSIVRRSKIHFASSLYMPSSQVACTPALPLEELQTRAGFERFTLVCDIEGTGTEWER
jgi:hypothetical protein